MAGCGARSGRAECLTGAPSSNYAGHKSVSNRYLLPCDCGQTVVVDPSQAGDRVECPGCGNRLDVPTLRRLRDLEPAQSDASAETTWGLNQALFTVGLLVTCLLAGGSAYFAIVEPEPPPPFNPTARDTLVSQNLQKLDPIDVWGMWITAYKPLEKVGLAPMKTQAEILTLARIETCRTYRNQLLAAAAVVLVLSFAVFKTAPSGASSESR